MRGDQLDDVADPERRLVQRLHGVVGRLGVLDRLAGDASRHDGLPADLGDRQRQLVGGCRRVLDIARRLTGRRQRLSRKIAAVPRRGRHVGRRPLHLAGGAGDLIDGALDPALEPGREVEQHRAPVLRRPDAFRLGPAVGFPDRQRIVAEDDERRRHLGDLVPPARRDGDGEVAAGDRRHAGAQRQQAMHDVAPDIEPDHQGGENDAEGPDADQQCGAPVEQARRGAGRRIDIGLLPLDDPFDEAEGAPKGSGCRPRGCGNA